MTYVCPADHSHGLNSTCYTNHGCRCAACKEARRVRDSYEIPCNYCGIQFMVSGRTSSRLCGDCRFVLSVREKRLWK